MRSSRTPRRAIALLAALLPLGLAPGCGGGAELPPSAFAEHLDPRLPDGGSPARAWAEGEVEVAAWTFGGEVPVPSPWVVAGGRSRPGGPHGGLVVVPEEGQFASLEHADPFDASAFDVVRVELAQRKDGRTRLAWQRPGRSRDGLDRVHLRGSNDVQVLEYSMIRDLAWEGELSGLSFQPTTNEAQSFELLSIRFLRRGFEAGASPTDPAGVDGGDAGVVALKGDAYRAWPLGLDVPLADEVDVPPGGRLSFATAIVPGTSFAPYELSVTATPLDGGASERLLTHAFLPSEVSTSWGRLEADLDHLAGRRVRLEFTLGVGQRPADAPALPSGTPGSRGARASALLGAPVVTGDLPADRRPNVLLVTMDTTRFDALGPNHDPAARDPRVHTPFLDDLAAHSLVFTDTWSAGNSTQPSHASILTGLSIQDHALIDNYGILSPSVTTLAEALRGAGYYTAAAVSLEAVGATSGFAQGFDQFAPPAPDGHLDGRAAVETASRWIGEWSEAGDRPWFLWVHVYDPHTPYQLPEGALDAYTTGTGLDLPPARIDEPTLVEPSVYPAELQFLRGINNRDHVRFLYHVEVAYMDSLLASLFDAVERSGTADETLSVLTADHGEHLGERAVYYTHLGLTPETLHVPLLLHLPESVAGGAGEAPSVGRVPDRVTSRDITPTILSRLGIARVPAERDLVEVARSGGDPARVFWFEHANGFQVGCRDERYHFVTTTREGFHFGVEPALVDGGPYIYLRSLPVPVGTSFLYDWHTDPGLEHDLAAERPEVVAEYLEKLAAYRAEARPFSRTARDMSPEEEAQLEALGYTGK